MTDKELLLRDIILNPEDLAPRHAYADDLLVSNDPHERDRGELIAAMLRLPDLRIRCISYDAWGVQVQQEDERGNHITSLNLPVVSILQEAKSAVTHYPGASEEYPRYAKSVVYRRGFIEEIEFGSFDWVDAYLIRIFKSHPIRRVFGLNERPGYEPGPEPYYYWTVNPDRRATFSPDRNAGLRWRFFEKLKYRSPNSTAIRVFYGGEEDALADYQQAILGEFRGLAHREMQ